MGVRDHTGSWRIVGHLLAQTEDGDILAETLKVFKKWSKRWLLRYMLTDDSAAEQKAVREAFPDLDAGEQEVTHLLYLFHSDQTLKRNFKGDKLKKTFRYMHSALHYRCTEVGCLESILAAKNSLR